ncbi:MAG TPA: glycosyltransferase [Candidatus Paceibacterota bacterium]|nr:glycosyltransferase [Candidatus Paceibacterota bacterium]
MMQGSPRFTMLLLYDADREIDGAHPLYNEIMLFAQQCTELHVMVYIPRLPIAHQRVVSLGPTVIVYYLPRPIFWRIDELWPMARYHLLWQKHFRPDVIINHCASATGTLVACALAKRFHRPLFGVIDGDTIEAPVFSRKRFTLYLLTTLARSLVVQSDYAKTLLIRRLHPATKKVTVVPPAVDLSFLARATDAIHYATILPQHNFFILTEASIGEKRSLHEALAIVSRVLITFPHAALVVVAPSDQLRSLRRFIEAHHVPSVYVYARDDMLSAYYAGAHLCMVTSTAPASTASIIRALALHVPVVATTSERAAAILAGSPYDRFLVRARDTEGFAHAIEALMSDQRSRDDYRLNAPVLLQSLSLQTLSGSVAGVMAAVQASIEK